MVEESSSDFLLEHKRLWEIEDLDLLRVLRKRSTEFAIREALGKILRMLELKKQEDEDAGYQRGLVTAQVQVGLLLGAYGNIEPIVRPSLRASRDSNVVAMPRPRSESLTQRLRVWIDANAGREFRVMELQHLITSAQPSRGFLNTAITGMLKAGFIKRVGYGIYLREKRSDVE